MRARAEREDNGLAAAGAATAGPTAVLPVSVDRVAKNSHSASAHPVEITLGRFFDSCS